MNALQVISLRAPQWATDPRINDMIQYSRECTSAEVFGENTERAIALRVLHMFALESQRNGNPGTGTSSGAGHAGALTSESEGQLSKSFASGSTSSWAYQRYGNLATTIYGQELIELIRGNVFSPTTRRGDASDTYPQTGL